MHLRCVARRSPRGYALRALCLSEARPQPVLLSSTPPVCTRFARLDWGYEKLCLSEAQCHAISEAQCHAIPHAPYIPNTVVGGTPTLLQGTSRQLHRAAGTFLLVMIAPMRGHSDDPVGRTQHGHQSPPQSLELQALEPHSPFSSCLLPFGS